MLSVGDGGGSRWVQLQERLLSHLEPARTWRYEVQRVRLWPVLLPALLLFFSVLAFLIASNCNSVTCLEQLRYARWEGSISEAQGCHAVDSLASDWSPWSLQVQLETPPVLPMYTYPTVDLLSATSLDGRSVYSPTAWECGIERTTVTALPSIQVNVVRVNFSDQPPSDVRRYKIYLLVDAVIPDVHLTVSIASMVSDQWGTYLRSGSGNFSYRAADVDNNGTGFRVLNTTWVGPYAQVAFVVEHLYVHLLPLAMRLWLVPACGDYALKQHLQSCRVCSKTSPVTIAWIIVLGVVQAITGIASMSAWLIRRYNKDKVIKEEHGDVASIELGHHHQQQPQPLVAYRPDVTQLLLS